MTDENNQKRRIPLSIVLIAPFIAQIVLAISLVGYFSFRNGQRAVNNVAHQLRREVTARIEEHLHTFLATPHQFNQVTANAIQLGLIDAADQDALERYFWEQIQVFDSVTSHYFGNTRGGLVDAGREGAEGALYVIVTDRFTRGTFRKYATDGAGNRTELLSAIPDFDARTRDWYIDAVEERGATWSDIYILFTGQDMNISANLPVYDEEGNLLGVVSTSIFLSHIGDFLHSLDIGETGESFIIERSGLLVASSADEAPFTALDGNEPQRRLYAYESSVPHIKYAAEFLTAQLGDYQAVTEKQHFEFELDGRRQFLQVTPVRDEYGLDWLVVVVIPEAEFMAQINANNRATAWLIVAALLVAVVAGIVTARWVAMPIAHLNDSAQALAKGDWEQKIEGSRIKELNELALSFDDMARRLQESFGKLEDTNTRLRWEVTERRQAEEQLKRYTAELQRSNEDLQQFAHVLSHDLQTPLRMITRFLELLKQGYRDELDAEAQEFIDFAVDGATQMSQLIRALLGYSRIESWGEELVPVSAEAVLESVLQTMRFEIEDSGAVVTHDSLPNVLADEAQLRQLLQNLVGNALKFRGEEPPRVHISVTPSPRPFAEHTRESAPQRGEGDTPLSLSGRGVGGEGEWLFAVRDNGIGIATEYHERIFGVFERLHTREEYDGTGIGLATCKRIVERHGGRIRVESEEGAGATFYFTLRGVGSEE